MNLSFRQIVDLPRNYLGIAPDKLEVLSRYRVSLVLENSLDYFSEKLLDALYSFTIPVYCGPDPEHLGLPRGLVVLCKPNIEDLARGVEEALSMDYEEWLMSARQWMGSAQSRKSLLAENVWGHVLGRIIISSEGGKYADQE
jgi:hypothetical protein